MPSRFPLFPDHEVLAEMGRGTIGTVYKVLSRRFRDVRALKRVADPGAELAHRIKREFRRLTAIDHPTIVKPAELFSVAEALCLTSAFVEGRDLHSFLGRDAAADPERVRQAIYLTGQALKAYSFGIFRTTCISLW